MIAVAFGSFFCSALLVVAFAFTFFTLSAWQLAAGVSLWLFFGAVWVWAPDLLSQHQARAGTRLQAPRVRLAVDEHDTRLVHCRLASGEPLCDFRLPHDLYEAIEQAAMYQAVVDDINDEITIRFGDVLSATAYAKEVAAFKKLEAKHDRAILAGTFR